MKLVIVDDDPETSELLKVIGAYNHIEVIGFTESLEALKWLDANEADAVILDLELPIIDGLRLAKEIRKNEELHPEKRPTKLVFYTGHDIDDTIERVGDRVGVEKRYMIHKPYDLGELVNELKKDLGE